MGSLNVLKGGEGGEQSIELIIGIMDSLFVTSRQRIESVIRSTPLNQ